MKLLEVLKEATLLEKNQNLFEAKKQAKKGIKQKIKTKYDAKSKQAEKFAAKLRARKGSITWSDDTQELRNEIIVAFMANDADKVINMMTSADGYKTIEILKAMEVAHGGYEKLELTAGKAGKKDFIKTVFAYIDDSSSEETNDKEEEKEEK